MILRSAETIIGWSLSLLVGYFVLHCVLEIAKRRALLNVNWLPLVHTFRTRYYMAITSLTREVELLREQFAV